MVSGIRDLDVRADVVEADGSAQCTVHEQIPSSKSVNQEEEPDDCNYGFYDSKNSSSQQTGICAYDTDGLEDCGRVVVDSIDSRSVLPEEERATKEETVGDFGVVGECAEGLPEAQTNR